MEIDTKEIAVRLKKLRQSLNMTVVEFSEKLGYKGVASYHNIEKGKAIITIDFLNKASRTFGVSVASLLGLEDGAGADQGRVKELERRVKELEEMAELKNQLATEKLFRYSALFHGMLYYLFLIRIISAAFKASTEYNMDLQECYSDLLNRSMVRLKEVENPSQLTFTMAIVDRATGNLSSDLQIAFNNLNEINSELINLTGIQNLSELNRLGKSSIQ